MPFEPTHIMNYLARHKATAQRRLASIGKVAFIKEVRANTTSDYLVRRDFLVTECVGSPLGLMEAKLLTELIDPNFPPAPAVSGY